MAKNSLPDSSLSFFHGRMTFDPCPFKLITDVRITLFINRILVGTAVNLINTTLNNSTDGAYRGCQSHHFKAEHEEGL